jgi:hypothetical protein
MKTTSTIKLFHATRLENIPSIMKYGLLTSSMEGVTYFTDNPIASWQWMIYKYKIYGENINFNFGIVHAEIDQNDKSLSKATDHSSHIFSIIEAEKFRVFEYSADLSPEELTYFHIFHSKDGRVGINEYQNCFKNQEVAKVKREVEVKNSNDFEKMLSSGLSVITI